MSVEELIEESKRRNEIISRASMGIERERIEEKRQRQQERLRKIERFLDKPLFSKSAKRKSGQSLKLKIKPGIKQFF